MYTLQKTHSKNKITFKLVSDTFSKISPTFSFQIPYDIKYGGMNKIHFNAAVVLLERYVLAFFFNRYFLRKLTEITEKIAKASILRK